MSGLGDDHFHPNFYSMFPFITCYLSKLFSATLYAVFIREQPMAHAVPELPMLLWSLPCPPTRNQDIRSFVEEGNCLFFPMSSESTSPEWNTRTIFYRVGDTEMMRIKGQIGPFFHFLKSCTVVYRGYIFWYGSHCCLLAKQKQKVVSCVSFSNLLLRFLSIHACNALFQWPKWLWNKGWALSVGTCGNCFSFDLRIMNVVAVEEVHLPSSCHACHIISFRRSTFLLTTLCHPCVRWC